MDIIQQLNKVDFFESSKTYPKLNKNIAKHGFELEILDDIGVHHVRQVHGNNIIELEKAMPMSKLEDMEADAIYSKIPGEKIGVKTADCLPVLFSSSYAVCASHAGWRGLSQNIISKSLALFKRDAISMHSINVLIGPAISVSKFEVGPEVVDAFEVYSNQIGKEAFFACLTKGLSDRWYIDLQQLAIFECISNGVPAENIAVMRTCTMTNTYWHSYRRSAKEAGRIFSWIQL